MLVHAITYDLRKLDINRMKNKNKPNVTKQCYGTQRQNHYQNQTSIYH